LWAPHTALRWCGVNCAIARFVPSGLLKELCFIYYPTLRAPLLEEGEWGCSLLLQDAGEELHILAAVVGDAMPVAVAGEHHVARVHDGGATVVGDLGLAL